MKAASGLGEFGRIARFFAPLAAGAPGALGLTDDAALVEVPLGQRLVLTVDAMVESVHFLPGDPPDLVARKLLRTNLSDLAAMAAIPLGYLLAMALPARCGDDWVEAFASGLAADQGLFGVHLLGGDSVSTAGPVTLSITALGTVEAGREVRRSGAKAGDVVMVTGTIGDGAIGLLAAQGMLSDLVPAERDFLADRYRLPQPRATLGPRLAGLANAMLDVSDGLAADLGHLCDVSGVAAILEAARVPLSPAASSAVALDIELLDRVLTGGDDYELLFTAASGAVPEIERVAAESGVPVTVIGRIVSGSGVSVLDRDGNALVLAQPGYRHV